MTKQDLIEMLFESAPHLDNDITKTVLAAAPHGCEHGCEPSFLECQLVFKGGYTVSGVLTDAPVAETGCHTLRMLTPAKRAEDNKLIMADHYFVAEDVLTIVVARDLPRAPTILRAA